MDTSVIDELEVAQELHLSLYRILQERLTNILKYAKASKTKVLFDSIDVSLVVKVINDGRDFKG